MVQQQQQQHRQHSQQARSISTVNDMEHEKQQHTYNNIKQHVETRFHMPQQHGGTYKTRFYMCDDAWHSLDT